MSHAPNMQPTTQDRSETPAAPGVGSGALLGSIEREHIKGEAACAAKSLGIAREWAELMAKFEKAKAQP